MARWNQAAAKWSRSMQTASTAYTEGVNSVSVSPTEKAANAAEKYQMGVLEAVESGKYQAGLRAVSLTDWKKAAIEKGAGRLASGAKAAEVAVQRFWQGFGPTLDSVQAQVNSMPSNTAEERDQKMLRNAQLLREAGRKRYGK